MKNISKEYKDICYYQICNVIGIVFTIQTFTKEDRKKYKEKLEKLLEEYKNSCKNTDNIISLMLKLMKMQYFNDANKRTSMLVANHELIKNGLGIISVSEKNKIEFGDKLIKYYEEEENLNNIKEFIYEKCLDGILM